MRALVTGATGFVGAAVTRRLAFEDIRVRALVRENSDRVNISKLNIEIVTGDLNNLESLRRAVAGCDVVFHVAADYRLWARNPNEIVRTNVEGTRNIINVSCNLGVKKVVYTSSVATLGTRIDDTPANEFTKVSFSDMIGVYKKSKYLAEREVEKLIKIKGAPVIVVNPSTPIGPGDQKPTPTGRFVIRAALGKIPAFVDTGLNIAHVDDIAEGHILAMRHGVIGEKYILGGENMTLKEILVMIANIRGHRPPFIRLPHNFMLPVAWIIENWTKVTGSKDPMCSIDEVKMARKKMFFSSERAQRELGYTWGSPKKAISDSLCWFEQHGYLKKKSHSTGCTF